MNKEIKKQIIHEFLAAGTFLKLDLKSNLTVFYLVNDNIDFNNKSTGLINLLIVGGPKRMKHLINKSAYGNFTTECDYDLWTIYSSNPKYKNIHTFKQLFKTK